MSCNVLTRALSYHQLISSINKAMEKYIAHGLNPIRPCKPTEIEWIKQAYGMIKHHIEDATTETKWYSIYLNGQTSIKEDEFTKKFHEWTIKAIEETAGKGLHLHQYGFFFAPKANGDKSRKDQQYHIDHLPEICSIFIPMIHLTCNNSTRFMKSAPLSKPTQGAHSVNRFGKDDLELLEREGVDFLEFSQVICKPFTLLCLGPNTVHKGILNRGDYDRPMFFIVFSNQSDYQIPEQIVEHHSKIKENSK